MSDDKPLDLTALSALEQAATPRPWSANWDANEFGGDEGWGLWDRNRQLAGTWYSENGLYGESGHTLLSEADAEFIVALRNAAPDLIAENARLQRERDEARKVVAVVDDVRQGAGWTVQIYGVLIAQCDIYGKTEDVRRLEAENDALRAQIAWWEEKFPCDGLCSDAPEEDCSRHGRTPVDLWERYTEAANAAAALRATLARVEALADEWVGLTDEDDVLVSGTALLSKAGSDLLRALADAAPPATTDDPSEQACVKAYPEVGHEDEGYSCVTHNMSWDECPHRSEQEAGR